MNKISANTVVTVEPGKTIRIPRPGDFFYLIEATGPLLVGTDLGDYIPVTVGRGVNFRHRPFKWTQLLNPTAAPIRVSFYSGYARFIDKRLNVYNGQFLPPQPLAVSSPIIAEESPYYICSTGRLTLGEGESYIAGAETSHQYIAVCIPLSSSPVIEVRKNGILIARLSGSAIARKFNASGPLEFKNVSGGAKDFVIYSTQLIGNPCATPPPIPSGDFFLLPPLTEDTGELYPNEAAASLAIYEQASNCIGFDTTFFIEDDVSHTFSTTNPANQLSQIGSFVGQISAGSRARSWWSSQNLSAGDLNVHYIMQADQAAVICSVQLEVDLYDSDGNFINYYVTDFFDSPAEGDLIVPIPGDGRYIVNAFPGAYGDPLAASPLISTQFNLLFGQTGLTANSIKALYTGGEIIC